MYLEKWSENDIFMESVDQGGHNSLPGPGQTGKGRVALPYPRQCRPNLPPGGGHEACGIARDSEERAETELVWRTYTAAEALSMTRRLEIIDKICGRGLEQGQQDRSYLVVAASTIIPST